MKRLTQTSDKGGVAFTFDLTISCEPNEAKKILKLAEKLKQYEDLEEQGRLLRLPCKVGSNIYRITDDGIDVAECREITVADKEMYIESNTFCDWISFDEIGKTVFLTEAEAKLAEMEENHEGVSS